MILRCAHCRSKFQVDDALRGKTFRCRVCASPIKAEPADDRRAALAATEPAMAAPVPAARASSRPAQAQPSQRPAQSVGAQSVSPQSRAAVVRRDDERSKRDLFGQELQLSAKVVEHQNVASPFTAARNENSVLFSLDQLSKPRLPEQVPVEAPPVRAKADSGLIDLNALMSGPIDAKSVRPAPLSEPPLGAFTREVDSVPPANEIAIPAFKNKSRTKVYAGAAAAGVALFIGIGVMASSREDARVEAAAKAAAQAAPPPQATQVVAEPAPVPKPEPLAAKAPDTSSEETTRKATRSGGARKGGGAKSSKVSSSSASLPAAPAPKKAADPCGCKGDLMCNIKCSSK